MSDPSDYYGGQGRYSWDPRAVARVNRDQENRDFDGRMEEWDRRPRGRYDGYEFAERDRGLFWDQRDAGTSFYSQPHNHFEYRDRRSSIRFEDQQHDGRYDDRYYQDREFREVLSRPSYVNDEIYDQVERPREKRSERQREDRVERPRAERVERPGAERVDRRERKRRSVEEEDDVEVKEDASDDGESEQKEAESPERRPTDRSTQNRQASQGRLMSLVAPMSQFSFQRRSRKRLATGWSTVSRRMNLKRFPRNLRLILKTSLSQSNPQSSTALCHVEQRTVIARGQSVQWKKHL